MALYLQFLLEIEQNKQEILSEIGKTGSSSGEILFKKMPGITGLIHSTMLMLLTKESPEPMKQEMRRLEADKYRFFGSNQLSPPRQPIRHNSGYHVFFNRIACFIAALGFLPPFNPADIVVSTSLPLHPPLRPSDSSKDEDDSDNSAVFHARLRNHR